MKNLIIYAHPSEKSFNSAILKTVIEALNSKNEDYKLIDLYKENFKPTLDISDFSKMAEKTYSDDVKRYQQMIKESDKLIFIYPTWWWSYPAILKGFIDRVFSYGFAYRYNNGKIEGLLNQKALIFTTTGGTKEVYDGYKINEIITRQIKEGVLGFCGIKEITMKIFYAVPTVDNSTREKYLKEVKEIINQN